MAIDNYTSLLTAVGSNWLHRPDMTSVIPDFIGLFESEFNATMRVRQMERTTSIGSTSGYLAHPTQWRDWKNLVYLKDGERKLLQPISEEGAVIHTGDDTAGDPAYYKVRNDRTYLYPSPASTATVEATYYEGVTALGTSHNTNWLLNAYPGAYLYGSLEQAIPYVGDDQRIPVWTNAKERLLEMMKRESKKAENGSQVLKIRPDVRVP